MVWDLRPRIATVKSISSLPITGFAYACSSITQSTSKSTLSSPPPEYNACQTLATEPLADVSEPLAQSQQGLDAEALERALIFQEMKRQAIDQSRYVRQGLLMLQQSQAAQHDAQDAEEIFFSRDLYLTSLTYLVRGLPTDLNDTERHALQQSLRTIQARCEMPDNEPLDATRTQQLFVGLCRGSATLIRISVPRIKKGLETAIQFENQYHFFERSTIILSNSLNSIADRASRASSQSARVSRTGGFINSVYAGLGAGLCEGYRVLTSDNP